MQAVTLNSLQRMGKPKKRFVAKAEAENGWRVWDNKQKKWWGERYESFPENLLTELNAGKDPERLTELIKKAAPNRKKEKKRKV